MHQTDSYAEFRERECRLVILRVTAEGAGTANDALIERMLAHWGLRVTRAQVRTSLAWLQENGFVTTTQLDHDVLRVAITRRGREIADGRATHPDITPRGHQAI